MFTDQELFDLFETLKPKENDCSDMGCEMGNLCNTINDNGELVCTKCGLVSGYKEVVTYYDFYEKRHLIRRKNQYKLKYYFQKVANRSDILNGLSWKQRPKLVKIIGLIGCFNTDLRQRVIHINYLLICIFKLMDINSAHIRKPKSSITIIKFDQ